MIDIPALPLTPGDYRVEVQIKDRSKTVDFVGPAGEFMVNPADVFGGGYRFDSSGGFDDGCFVVPWDWELRPAPETTADISPFSSIPSNGSFSGQMTAEVESVARRPAS